MEKTTFYIHRDRDEDIEYYPDDNYRVVTFVNGNKDVTSILKDLIKTQYQP